MTLSLLSNLWPDLWADLRDPDILWQIATIAVCIIVARLVTHLLRKKFSRRNDQSQALRLEVESFSRVLPPALVFILIILIKPLLATWHHTNLLTIMIPLAVSFTIIRLAFYILRRVFVRGGRVGNFIVPFEKIFAAVIWIGVALYITGLWPDIIDFFENTRLPLGRHKTSLSSIVQACASVAVTLILALWAAALLEERLMQINTIHSSLRVVMARMGRALLILISILLSLSLVGIDLTVLSVFGGALGVGLGLGLQKIVGSYVSGFVILLERSLAIGDMVTVDKYYGQVTKINTRYTILRGLDGIESVVPNEMLISSPVQNYSLTDRTIRLATHVTVSYQTDIEKTLALLAEATANVDRVLKEPAPQAMLLKFANDGFELEIGFWIVDPENGKLSVLSEVNKAIWRVLQAYQIIVPYSQHEIRLIDERDNRKEKEKMSGQE
jgi:small-conductance mechanosensitive channel